MASPTSTQASGKASIRPQSPFGHWYPPHPEQEAEMVDAAAARAAVHKSATSFAAFTHTVVDGVLLRAVCS